MLFACFLVYTHNLRWFRGIDRLDFFGRLEPCAANDQVVLTSQLATHFVNRSAHPACIFCPAEIGQGFVCEWSLVQADLWGSWSFDSRHDCTSGYGRE